MADVKVLIGEIDGEELGFPQEHVLLGEEVPVTIPDYDSTNVRDAIEESTTKSGTARTPYGFVYDSNAGTNRWLELSKGVPSNTSPHIVPEDGELVAATVSNKNTITGSVRFYVNGILVYTLNITSSNKAFVSGLLIPVSAGDEISCQVGSGTLREPAAFVQVKTGST